MMEAFKNLFTGKGRSGRLEFLRPGLLILTNLLFIGIVSNFFSQSTHEKKILLSFLTIALIMTFISSFFTTIRRLHDINFSGWWIIITIIIPLLNFVLLFKKGTNGPNKYGEQTNTVNRKSFVIILAIIIANITILYNISQKPYLAYSNNTKLKVMAEKGDAVAQNNLGVTYLDGDGIAQDHEQAFKWLNLLQSKLTQQLKLI